jgi:preprotein translocase subunit SecE
MTSDAETSSGRDDLKWAAAVFLLVAGISAFYYFGGHSLLLRVIGLLVVLVAAGAILRQTSQGRGAWAFVREARTEVRKVVWPTRKETVQTTSIVIATVTVVAVFLWLLDALLAWGVRTLMHGGS